MVVTGASRHACLKSCHPGISSKNIAGQDHKASCQLILGFIIIVIFTLGSCCRVRVDFVSPMLVLVSLVVVLIKLVLVLVTPQYRGYARPRCSKMKSPI